MSDRDDDRTPPKRVRISGLQETQIKRVLEIDAACAAQYHELGFDAAEVPVRVQSDSRVSSRASTA